jgi:cytochrome c oxidase assembly factor CtaG
VRRDHPARPWPRWRTGLFLGGLAVIVLATQSGIGVYDGVLFWVHMIQHLLLIMVAPPLLVIGQPATLLLHASRNPLHTWAKRALRSRVVSALTWPPFVLAAYTGTIVATHLTGLADLMMTNETVHNAEHVLYLVVGYLFFLPLLGREPIRWRVSYPIRLLILVLSMPVDTFTGLVLGYATKGSATGGVRPPGSPDPVTDMHWGGALMWIGGDAIMIVFMLAMLALWAQDDRAATHGQGWLEAARKTAFERAVAGGAGAAVPAGTGPAGTGATGTGPATGGGGPARAAARRGGIDDDEHLAAYNAYLARLHRSGS